ERIDLLADAAGPLDADARYRRAQRELGRDRAGRREALERRIVGADEAQLLARLLGVHAGCERRRLGLVEAPSRDDAFLVQHPVALELRVREPGVRCGIDVLALRVEQVDAAQLD